MKCREDSRMLLRPPLVGALLVSIVLSLINGCQQTNASRAVAGSDPGSPIEARPDAVVSSSRDRVPITHIVEAAALKDIGAATDLQVAWDPKTRELQLIVAGTHACVWLERRTLRRLRTVPLRPSNKTVAIGHANVILCDLDGDGCPEAVQSAGPLGLSTLTAFSTTDGSPLWTYVPDIAEAPITMVACLASKDAASTVVVGCRHSMANPKGFDEQLRFLNGRTGKVDIRSTYRQSSGGVHIENLYCVIDVDHDGSQELVFADSGRLRVCDSRGVEMWSGKPQPGSDWIQTMHSVASKSGTPNAVDVIISASIQVLFGLGIDTRWFVLHLASVDGRLAATWKQVTRETRDILVRRSRGHVLAIRDAKERESSVRIEVLRGERWGSAAMVRTLWDQGHHSHQFVWSTDVPVDVIVAAGEPAVIKDPNDAHALLFAWGECLFRCVVTCE